MQNTILLCLEASENEENPLSDLYELAKLIGINIHIDSEPKIDNANALRLFVLISEEAMTNAVKHAGATDVYITVNQNKTLLSANYTNNGLNPLDDIVEGGGLKELRRRIEKQAAQCQYHQSRLCCQLIFRFQTKSDSEICLLADVQIL